MKTYVGLLLMAVVLLTAEAFAGQQVLPNRWVYLHGKGLEDIGQVEQIRQIAKTCSEHGLNGIVMSVCFDKLDLEPTYNFKNLREIQRICRKYKVELIPSFMGMGYNAHMLAHDKNLAEGLPVKDALFVVEKRWAGLVDDPPDSVSPPNPASIYSWTPRSSRRARPPCASRTWVVSRKSPHC